jgi:RNA polymerase sigma factor (sigma-70 family)
MRFAYNLTGDKDHAKDHAKDLVQETMLKALKYSDKFVIESNFRAWTFTIMKNTFINVYRRSIRLNTCLDQTEKSFFLAKQNFQVLMILIQPIHD